MLKLPIGISSLIVTTSANTGSEFLSTHIPNKITPSLEKMSAKTNFRTPNDTQVEKSNSSEPWGSLPQENCDQVILVYENNLSLNTEEIQTLIRDPKWHTCNKY
jgi:hypothetical protein